MTLPVVTPGFATPQLGQVFADASTVCLQDLQGFSAILYSLDSHDPPHLLGGRVTSDYPATEFHSPAGRLSG